MQMPMVTPHCSSRQQRWHTQLVPLKDLRSNWEDSGLRWGKHQLDEKRSCKLAERAYMAILVGYDKHVKDAVRLVPPKRNADGTITFYPTKVTKNYKVFDRVYPLAAAMRLRFTFTKPEAQLYRHLWTIQLSGARQRTTKLGSMASLTTDLM